MKKFLVSVGVLSLVVAGCGSGKLSERDAFRDATIESACLAFSPDSMNKDVAALETEFKAIYSGYGFDVEDDALFDTLSEKYMNDPEFEKEIEAGIAECSNGLLDGFTLDNDTDVEVEVEVDGSEETEGTEDGEMTEETELTEEMEPALDGEVDAAVEVEVQ
ncbi:hypothetical protein CVV38_02235 [Candidatus Peregrinibacteria bacterium HGW-Peregrinibacteria-1]|jgi:hypothetical protein|nr:MAG: hypothetical protein CVV38_02235 [Candidatus Peregrinibacteria bacterium HGW-Peregrinibacteria-1]